MFGMQFSTRLLLCRLGLVLFCLLPTLLVSIWIAWRSTSAFGAAKRAEWERELAVRLGVIVVIKQVSYPQPAIARLTDLQLLDPETLGAVARAGIVEVTAIKGGYAVETAQVVVEAEQL